MICKSMSLLDGTIRFILILPCWRSLSLMTACLVAFILCSCVILKSSYLFSVVIKISSDANDCCLIDSQFIKVNIVFYLFDEVIIPSFFILEPSSCKTKALFNSWVFSKEICVTTASCSFDNSDELDWNMFTFSKLFYCFFYDLCRCHLFMSSNNLADKLVVGRSAMFILGYWIITKKEKKNKKES